MSFGYLPLPLYVLLGLTVFGVLTYYSIKGWKNDPKTLSVGIFILGLSSLGACANRLGEELQIFGDGLSLIQDFTFWVGVIGTLLGIIGGLQKVKHDPYRRRIALISLGFLALIVLFMIVLVWKLA